MRTRTGRSRSPRPRRATAAVSALVVLATLGLAACSASGGGDPGTGVFLGGVRTIGLLRSYDSCDQLLADLKAAATAHVGPYGFGQPPVYYAEDMARTAEGGPMAPAAGAQQSATSAAPVEGQDYSGTNNQEQGVDEADVVKSDGTRLLVVHGDRLVYVDVTDPSAPRQRGTVALGDDGSGGYGSAQLLLDGDTALVISQVYDQGGADGTLRRAPGPYYPGGTQRTEVLAVDVSNPDSLQITDRFTVDGGAVAGRLVGGRARIVVRSDPLQFPWVYPQGPGGEDAATEANRKIIADSTIDQWLPRMQHGKDDAPALDCSRVYVPKTFGGLGMVAVYSVPVADHLEPAGVGLLAESDAVYASTRHLVVAAHAWVDPAKQQDQAYWEEQSTKFTTDLHEFSLTGDGADYVASGQVQGHILSQYSLSDQDGYLRVATTDGPTWARPDGQEPQSESFVTVLRADGSELRQVGRVGSIGRGEQIKGVRFAGDRAYVVTFRQIDPFYVVDLSDPTAPRVAGEVKLPGYSGYLHPLDATHVLGVGQDSNPDTPGHTELTGGKVSLFDVSDPSAPRTVTSWTLPGGSTQVELDEKAFLWWPRTRLAVVPVTFGTGGPIPMEGDVVGPTAGAPASTAFTGAVGLHVTDDAITEVGRVTHQRDGQYGPPILRSMVVGDRLLTLSDQGLLSSDLTTLAAPGTWLPL